MSQYKWILESVVHAIHDEQIAEHGGLQGSRDITLLQSALGRPQNLANYGEPDIAELAASYGYGIARNHPFNDGNKRTAFVVVELFLMLNGYELVDDEEVSDSKCNTFLFILEQKGKHNEFKRIQTSLRGGTIHDCERFSGWSQYPQDST